MMIQPPPPPLHSLILQSLLHRLMPATRVNPPVLQLHPPSFQPPVSVPGTGLVPGGLTGPNQPGQHVPAPGPTPGGLNTGPNQPGQHVPSADTYNGDGLVHLLSYLRGYQR